MSKTELLPHSPLGGSSAERWMECPGSVTLGQGCKEDEDDEFSGPGKAAHAVACYCLSAKHDAWEMIGQHCDGETTTFYPMPDMARPDTASLIDKEMADAVQVYLDAVRLAHPGHGQGNTWIERQFHCPKIHELMYGQSDLTFYDVEARMLHVWDFKYGAGIVVDAPHNVQCMYYACGMLEDLCLWDEVDRVVLHIAQPRGFHFDGPLRSWAISTDDLLAWLETILVPAMHKALVSRDTASGEHCRFCPARGRWCPQIMADLKELEELMTAMNEAGGAPKLTAVQIGRLLDLMVPAMIARKQALKNGTGMLNAGHKVPGWKLAKARTNREWKAGTPLQEKFGDNALVPKTLKSPAQIDKMPEGNDFTARWAFKPDGGNTLVPEGDSRMAVNKDTKSMFVAAAKKRKKS